MQKKKFNAARGGHAPGHLRDAFTQWLEEEYVNAAKPAKTVSVGGEQRPLKWLLGQLWNCTDALPGDFALVLEMQRPTYARAARKVAAEL